MTTVTKMTIASKIRTTTRTISEAVMEGGIWASGWTVLGIAGGIGVIGLYESFVNGNYQGNIVEQFLEGAKQTIPGIADAPVYKVITKDLSASLVGAIIGKGVDVVRRIKQSTSANYQEKKSQQQQRDTIDEQAGNMLYAAKVEATTAKKIEKYKQRSPTTTG